jgi:two-component system cell cycle sensor histidine kinase/response regulator CckA
MTTTQRTILLVDDEETTRSHIRRGLERSGYRVLTAKDFNDAVDKYHGHSDEIDLLLTDVALPGLSGCDLAIALREENPALRVLLISGYTGAELLQFYGVHLSDVHFVQKPFRIADLSQRITYVFERFGSAA